LFFQRKQVFVVFFFSLFLFFSLYTSPIYHYFFNIVLVFPFFLYTFFWKKIIFFIFTLWIFITLHCLFIPLFLFFYNLFFSFFFFTLFFTKIIIYVVIYLGAHINRKKRIKYKKNKKKILKENKIYIYMKRVYQNVEEIVEDLLGKIKYTLFKKQKLLYKD
jgi:hypothetical protein